MFSIYPASFSQVAWTSNEVQGTCCGSALAPAALVAPGSRRRHVRLSSTRPSSSNSTYGRLKSTPIRASAARRFCGLSFSFSLLFPLSFYLYLFHSLPAGAEPSFLFLVSPVAAETCSLRSTCPSSLSSIGSFSRSGITPGSRLHKFCRAALHRPR